MCWNQWSIDWIIEIKSFHLYCTYRIKQPAYLLHLLLSPFQHVALDTRRTYSSYDKRSFRMDETDPPSWQGSPLAEQFLLEDSAPADAGHDRRRRQEARKTSSGEERSEGRREVRRDGCRDVTAGAISAQAVGSTLDANELYWWNIVLSPKTEKKNIEKQWSGSLFVCIWSMKMR